MQYLFSNDLLFSIGTSVLYFRQIERYSQTEDVGVQIFLEGDEAPAFYMLSLGDLDNASSIQIAGHLTHDVEIFYPIKLTKIFHLNFDIKLHGFKVRLNLNGDYIDFEEPEKFTDEKFVAFTDPGDLGSFSGGPQGPIGPQGPAGSKWYTDSGNPSNGLGLVGDFYLDISTGDVYRKTGAVTWTFEGNIKGPQGFQGPQGIQGIQGNQGPQGVQGIQGPIGSQIYAIDEEPPSSGFGVNEDFAISNDSGNLYKKIAGTWELVGNIRGPQGFQGIPGIDGQDFILGFGVPSGGLGNNGDTYLDYADDNGFALYTKVGGVWNFVGYITAPVSLQGPGVRTFLNIFQEITSVETIVPFDSTPFINSEYFDLLPDGSISILKDLSECDIVAHIKFGIDVPTAVGVGTFRQVVIYLLRAAVETAISTNRKAFNSAELADRIMHVETNVHRSFLEGDKIYVKVLGDTAAASYVVLNGEDTSYFHIQTFGGPKGPAGPPGIAVFDSLSRIDSFYFESAGGEEDVLTDLDLEYVDQVSVFINGVKQYFGADKSYTVVLPATIHFNTPLIATDKVLVETFSGVKGPPGLPGDQSGSANFLREEFTAIGGETQVSLLVEQFSAPEQVLLFINGTLQRSSQYATPVPPSTIFLPSAATAGDLIEVALSTAGTQGIQGIAGADGTDGIDGEDGVGVPAGGTFSQFLKKVDGTDFNTVWQGVVDQIAIPARTLNSIFQIAAAQWTFVSYSIEIAADDGESGIVELQSGSSSPPGTVRSSAENNFNVTGIGVGGASTQRFQLSAFIPPGHFVRLATSGTASFSIINQEETLF